MQTVSTISDSIVLLNNFMLIQEVVFKIFLNAKIFVDKIEAVFLLLG